MPILVVVAGAIAVSAIFAAFWTSSPPMIAPALSQVLTIPELRSWTNFTLGGVRFVQTGFADFQTGPIVDGGYVASFAITFFDGASEHVDFHFDGYCPSGSVDQTSTVHRGPAARFRYVCGDDFIRVTVLK